ncbi:MAG TPA: cupin domain-containing protein [Gammaproteobacteria bacterium]|nr:cupin domain-containing protein [Gammaproteobacteria bacterium]
MQKQPIRARDVAATRGQSIYPAPFAQQVAGRTKRRLGDVFGLGSFGVNLTTLDPGAVSALYHCHAVQDEFVLVLDGRATIVAGNEEYEAGPGECIGFKGGTGIAHQLVNRTDAPVTYLEVGDRMPGDRVEYPRDDLAARQGPGGAWIVTHKDGTPY